MSDEREQLRRSWVANAGSWRDAVRERRIESRRVATDAAVVEVVNSLAPARVIDLGCGEGWLVRELAAQGMEACGTDASAPLIDAARELGGGSFYPLSYEELIAAPLPMAVPFDVAVANFSILDEDLGPIVGAASRLLGDSGALVIQTVHPAFATGDAPYVPGWRTETFASIEGEWPEPMPWYFRTLSAWVHDLSAHGFSIDAVREPMDAQQVRPLSMIFVCRSRDTRMMDADKVRLDAFAAAAEEYCAWAEGEAGKAVHEARMARTLIAELFRRAIELPQIEEWDADAPAIPDDEYQHVYRRFGALPFNYYSECFQPLIVPAEEPVTADLADDLADVWRDVKAGLLLFRSGNRPAAAWQWRFHFDVHWAHHATGALYALQAWFSEHEHELDQA